MEKKFAEKIQKVEPNIYENSLENEKDRKVDLYDGNTAVYEDNDLLVVSLFNKEPNQVYRKSLARSAGTDGFYVTIIEGENPKQINDFIQNNKTIAKDTSLCITPEPRIVDRKTVVNETWKILINEVRNNKDYEQDIFKSPGFLIHSPGYSLQDAIEENFVSQKDIDFIKERDNRKMQRLEIEGFAEGNTQATKGEIKKFDGDRQKIIKARVDKYFKDVDKAVEEGKSVIIYAGPELAPVVERTPEEIHEIRKANPEINYVYKNSDILNLNAEFEQEESYLEVVDDKLLLVLDMKPRIAENCTLISSTVTPFLGDKVGEPINLDSTYFQDNNKPLKFTFTKDPGSGESAKNYSDTFKYISERNELDEKILDLGTLKNLHRVEIEPLEVKLRCKYVVSQKMNEYTYERIHGEYFMKYYGYTTIDGEAWSKYENTQLKSHVNTQENSPEEKKEKSSRTR